jgi:hypothetical protein
MGKPYGIAVNQYGQIFAAFNDTNMIGRYDPCGLTYTPECSSVCNMGMARAGNAFKANLANKNKPEVTAAPTPTITITPSETPVSSSEPSGLISVAPNISRAGEPINFAVNLLQSARMDLVIFTVMGEEIYRETVEGNAGTNVLDWRVCNQDGRPQAVYMFTPLE